MTVGGSLPREGDGVGCVAQVKSRAADGEGHGVVGGVAVAAQGALPFAVGVGVGAVHGYGGAVDAAVEADVVLLAEGHGVDDVGAVVVGIMLVVERPDGACEFGRSLLAACGKEGQGRQQEGSYPGFHIGQALSFL